MKWLKRIERDKRGEALQPLVPEMLKYVAEHYKPLVQYCLSPAVRPVPAPKPEEKKTAETGSSSGKTSYSIQVPPPLAEPSPKVS